MDIDRTVVDRVYEAPQLQFVGSLEDLTRGSSTGTHLDSAFPGGTASGLLTFS